MSLMFSGRDRKSNAASAAQGSDKRTSKVSIVYCSEAWGKINASLTGFFR